MENEPKKSPIRCIWGSNEEIGNKIIPYSNLVCEAIRRQRMFTQTDILNISADAIVNTLKAVGFQNKDIDEIASKSIQKMLEELQKTLIP